MTQALQQDEAACIARIVDGERELFHDLVRPYERAVYLTLLSMLRNSADAEDAAQEAMLKAYRGLKNFRGTAKFSTWLTAVAINVGRDRLARSARSKEDSLDEQLEKYEGDFTPAMLTDWRLVPNEALEQKELAAKIEEAVAKLPAAYRQVFTLRDVEQLEVEEVAGLLDVTSNVVRVRLHRARSMLQKQLVPVLKYYAEPKRRGWLGGWR